MRSLISIRGHAARCTQLPVTLIDDETQDERAQWEATSVDYPGFVAHADSPEEAADALTGKIARSCFIIINDEVGPGLTREAFNRARAA